MIGRLVTAAVGIPALALVVWLGGPVFSVVVAGVAAIGAIEVCEMARSRGEAPSRAAAMTLSVALVLSSIVFSYSPSTPEYVPLLTALHRDRDSCCHIPLLRRYKGCGLAG